MEALMIVKFRCRQSGNFVQFSDPLDIELMRKEPEYDEVKDEPVAVVEQEPIVEVKRGRPRKEMQPQADGL